MAEFEALCEAEYQASLVADDSEEEKPMSDLEQTQKEDDLLRDLWRELYRTAPDEEQLEDCRSNMDRYDVQDAANGDLAALVRLRRMFGLPTFS